MRYLYLILLIPFIMACSSEPDNTYSIKGTVSDSLDLNGFCVYITPSVAELKNTVLDSCFIENGTFSMKGNSLPNSELVSFIVTDTVRKFNRNSFGSIFVLESGNISMDIQSADKIDVYGTKSNDVLLNCKRAMVDFDSICSALVVSDLSARQRYDEMVVAQQNRNKIIKDNIMADPNSVAVPFILNEMHMLFDEKELSEILDCFVVDNDDDVVKNVHDQLVISRTVARGQRLDNFTLVDEKRDTSHLYDYLSDHDYILLDFWASWCGPCVRMVKSLFPVYESVPRSRFDIMGISLDKNEQKWLDAIEDNAIPWKNFSSLMGWEGPLVRKLSINYLPTSYLLDSNATVICRNPSVEELKIYIQK